MNRIDKINSLLIKELGELVSQEISLENSLTTITYVKTSADLRHAKVGISVLPENQSGSAVKQLKKNSRRLRDRLKKKLSLKIIPNLSWEFDDRERRAEKIEKIINSPEF